MRHTALSAALATAERLAQEAGRLQMRERATLTVPGWEAHANDLVSEVDLAIRGEGTLFGSRQSGMPDLKVAKLLRDVDVLVEARREAFALVANDPTLKRPDHGPLRREIRELLGADVEWLFRE